VLPPPPPNPQALPTLLELTERVCALVDAAGPGRAVDVADLAKRITSDVMGGLLFGEDLGGVAGRWGAGVSVRERAWEGARGAGSWAGRGLVGTSGCCRGPAIRAAGAGNATARSLNPDPLSHPYAPPTPPPRPSEYMGVFNLLLEATHARFVNPLRPLMALWDKQARGRGGKG
jgi:hypothetical protein